VDLPYRLFVVNLQPDAQADGEEHVFINPVITARKGSSEDREGCLSLPEIYAPVVRSEKISVNAYDLSGNELAYELEGLAARAAQHEIDHLDGILFIDRLSPTAKLEIKEALEELELEFSGGRRRGTIPEDGLITARLMELEAART
jgi:peptide deformylase